LSVPRKFTKEIAISAAVTLKGVTAQVEVTKFVGSTSKYPPPRGDVKSNRHVSASAVAHAPVNATNAAEINSPNRI
jgi:hypothetical protein